MTLSPILILAAGASTRMRGRDKLLEPVSGEPLLARQIRIAKATGAPVLVALPPGDGPRRSLVRDAVTAVTVGDCASGMAASIRAGMAALPSEATGVMVLLADMPEIEQEDLSLLLHAHADTPNLILRGATAMGIPGHPVLFPARHFGSLAQLMGDMGARDLLASEPATLIPLPGQRALVDLDTPEDWQDWRRRTGR